MSDSTLVKSAHIAATVTAAAASGGIVGLSFFAIPAIALPSRNATGRARETPGAPVSHVAQQWSFVYNTGKVVFPSIAAASGLLYSYVAYAVRDAGPRGRYMSNLYFTAAGLVVMIAPITGMLVLPVNKKIEPYVARGDDKLVAEGEGQRDSEFPRLLRKWAQVNVIRGLFPAVGAVLGTSVAFGLL